MERGEEDQEDYLQLRRNISEEAPWKQMQKKTFTRWANEHLRQAGEQIVNLERDLSDGLLLTRLLEILSKKELGTKEMMRHKKLDTVTKALKFLEQNEKIRLVSIDSVAIVDGQLKLILGLLWKLILHYSICMPTDTDQQPAEKNVRAWLLGWINDKMKNHKVGNFKGDWRSGVALGALVDGVAPGLCPEWEDWNTGEAEENIRVAMETADKWLGVAQLISPDDLLSSEVDELSMITYLSQFQHASLKTGAPLRARVRAYGPGLDNGNNFVDDPTNFTVETFCAGTLDICVLDPESSCIERSSVIRKDKKQTYVCNYVPQIDGQFQVVIKFNDQELVKSPFQVMVKRGTNKEKLLQRKLDALESKLLQEQCLSGKLKALYDTQLLDQQNNNKQCHTEQITVKEKLAKEEDENRSLNQQLLDEKENSDRCKEHSLSLMDRSLELTDKCHQNESEIRILNDQVSELNLYSKSQDEQLESVHIKLQNELNKSAALQNEIELLKENLVLNQIKSADLELELRRLMDQSRELKDKTSEFEEEIQSLKAQICNLEQKSKMQNEEINSLVTELVEEQAKSTEFEDEVRCLHDALAYEKEQFKRLEADTTFLRDQWTESQSKAAHAEMEIQNLKDVLLEGQEISSQYLVEIKCLTEQLTEAKEISHEYEIFNESLKKQLLNEQQRFTDSNVENKRLVAQLTENVSEIKLLNTTILERQNRLTTYEQEMKNQVHEKQTISEQYEKQINKLKQVAMEEQVKSEEFEYELVYKSNRILELMENEKQLTILENKLQNEHDTNRQLEERIKSLGIKLTDEQDKVREIAEQNKHFKAQEDLFQQTNIDNNVLTNQLLASRKRTKDLEVKVSHLKEELYKEAEKSKQSSLQNECHKDTLMSEMGQSDHQEKNNNFLLDKAIKEKNLSISYNEKFEGTAKPILHLETQSKLCEGEIRSLRETTITDHERNVNYKNEIKSLKQRLFEETEKANHYKELFEEEEEFKKCGKALSGIVDVTDAGSLKPGKRFFLGEVTGAMLSSTNDRFAAKRMVFPVGLFGTLSAAVVFSLGYKLCGQLSYINCLQLYPLWLIDSSEIFFSRL